MNGSAAVRIGRVRMKGGGADIRILERAGTDNNCVAALRSWARDVADDAEAPDAVVAVSFVYRGGQWLAYCMWHSDHPALPIRLLPGMARESLCGLMVEARTADAVLRRLGYWPVEPDPAA